ncbi:MAG: hypothetical protein H6Q61_1168 [Firmicutes bacterium]|nr:hypothetical protein [Bacillota bacterium]
MGGRRANQRQKVMAVYQILARESDRQHPVSLPTLIERLEAKGIPAERKSLYRDMDALREAGLPLAFRAGAEGGWYLEGRGFEPAEVKMLVDIVQAARFLTPRKSRELIDKLAGLLSRHDGETVRRQVSLDNRTKTENEAIYENVDHLHEAISAGRDVRFRYTAYNLRKEKVLRHGGWWYRVSPRALLWDHENYYLAAYDYRHQELRHYRVDKIQELALAAGGAGCTPEEDFDEAQHVRQHFGMYRGQTHTLQLRCEASLVGVILDRFGLETELIPDGEQAFICRVEVALSPQFWGWLFALSPEVELQGPLWAVQLYKQRLRDALSLHLPFAEKEKPWIDAFNGKIW